MGKKAAAQRLIDRFQAARLYAITCPPTADLTYEQMVEAVCRGGADIVQFRDKTLSAKERYAMALRLADICYDHDVLFIVNDALDLALAVGADGCHLGQDDLPLAAARILVNKTGVQDFILGCSTHSLEQAVAAETEGADYIGIGPVFATPTKPTYMPVGLELVRQVTSQVKVPHVAIGGIEVSNVKQVLDAGAQRVAVVRAACGASDIEKATRELKELLMLSVV